MMVWRARQPSRVDTDLPTARMAMEIAGAALSGRLFQSDEAHWQRRLLAEVPAAVFATEQGSRLADEAVAPRIPLIVAVAVIVSIRTAER